MRLSEGLSPLPSLPGRPSCGSSSEGPGSLYGGAGPAGGADHRGAGRGLGMSQTPGTPQLLSAPPSPQLPSQMQGREGRSVWAHVAKSGRSAPAGGRRVVLGTRTGAHTRMAACSERQPSGRCFCNESSGALSPGNPSLETYVSDRLCTWCAGGASSSLGSPQGHHKQPCESGHPRVRLGSQMPPSAPGPLPAHGPPGEQLCPGDPAGQPPEAGAPQAAESHAARRPPTGLSGLSRHPARATLGASPGIRLEALPRECRFLGPGRTPDLSVERERPGACVSTRCQVPRVVTPV